MNEMNLERIQHYFLEGHTKSYEFRKRRLKDLKRAILKFEKQLHEALLSDLHKSPEESWVTETGMVVAEINAALRHLKAWMRPERVETNILNFPSTSRVHKEPLGVVLIVAPWNYPFQLLMNPLVGAIAAGNCVVLKPSEFAPATSAVMQRLIEDTFEKDYIRFVTGDGSIVIPQMINTFTFDHIFYTGSTQVGRLIYKMAADKLIPVTLELGGKSPCIVESDANVAVAAKRIALTKFSNAGQMCVAPDYVLVHASVKERFVEKLNKAIDNFFGPEYASHENYGRIVNERQFDRLKSYLSEGRIVHGGDTSREKLFFAPTVMENIRDNSKLMQEEIFGPILPVISFDSKQEALKVIHANPNPLSFYVYTSSKSKEKDWLNAVPAGGTCINNSSWHLTNHNLPFGGRGFSGMGQYHGKFSFDTFTHKRAVMRTPTWFDPAIKYPPFKGKLRLFKWIVR